MTKKTSNQRNIAISISDCADMPFLGLSDGHLSDAMVEIARHLLSTGANLIYSQDLRKNSFNEELFELVARYKPIIEAEKNLVRVKNYLAWPVHIQKSIEEIEETIEVLAGSTQVVCLDVDGIPLTLKERRRLQKRIPTEEEWSRGLSSMRRHVLTQSNGRIILGGRVDKFKGVMPDFGEEALLSLRFSQPLYVIGGFGGCAGDVADCIGLTKERMLPNREWPHQKAFEEFSVEDLNNSLDSEENGMLARTPHIDQAITLILRGLYRANKLETSVEFY